MNITEQLKTIYRDEYGYFLKYHNDRSDTIATEIDNQDIKTSLFMRAILKFRQENPEIKQFMIDNGWMDSIIPKGSIENGAANDGLYKAYADLSKLNDYEFIKDLTYQEQQSFREDEKKLRDTEREMKRKYASIASKRITHETLMKEILSAVTLASIDKIINYHATESRHTEFLHDDDGEYMRDEEGNLKSITVTSKIDFQLMLEDNLNKQNNKTLQTILNLIRLIELPSKN